MEYKVNHIPKSPKRRPVITARMESITVHNTGNEKSSAMNEYNWLSNPSNTRTASWHIAIDEKQAIEAIPLNEVAYHAGDKEGNYTSIGIEVCESGNQIIVWDNAVKLIAKMLHERKWGVERVRTHKSWSGKYCPRLLLPRWTEFISDIKKELDKLTEPKSDVSTWAVEAQKWTIAKGITDGKEPKKPVTREELWTMLYRMNGGK